MHNKKPRTTARYNDTWEKAKEFKITKIEKKEGIDQSFNNIRIALNKISNKNYETQRDFIFGVIDDIVSQTDPEESISKLSVSIFDTASSNKFYSEMYAIFFKELVGKFSFFMEVVGPFIDQYKQQLSSIQKIDATEDFDLISENNKANDKRKAMSLFLVNLMKHGIIPHKTIFDILLYMQDTILSYIDDSTKTYELEEITENIFIIMTQACSHLFVLEGWSKVHENILILSKLKTKEHPGITNRSIFKYMDILDFIKKAGL
jgi:hypothetical protein